MEKVTGMMRQEEKSSTDQMETVLCMSLEVNRRTGGSSGMWRCDIPDSNGVQQSIYIYLGTPITGVWLCLWCFLSYSVGNVHK